MRFTLSLATLLAAAASSASAAALQVPVDHSIRLNLAGVAGTVLVGNPAVADVTVVDSRTVYVSGRGFGLTNIVVLDRMGRTLYDGDVVVAGAPTSISVYRGAARTDFACADGCQATVRLTSSGSASSAPSASAGGFGGGALGGVASALAGGAGAAKAADATTLASSSPSASALRGVGRP